MKKVLIVLAVMIMSFASSCELFDSVLDCEEDRAIVFKGATTVYVYDEDTKEPIKGELVKITYTKYRCDGSTTPMWSTPSTNSYGEGISNTYTIDIKNHNDYIVITAKYYENVQTKTYDENNINNGEHHQDTFIFNSMYAQ